MNHRVDLIVVWMLLISSACFAQGVWEWQNPLPQGSTLSYTRLWDNGDGVAVSTTGAILRTNDGGGHWQLTRNGSLDWMNCADFLTPEIGWVNVGFWSWWQILATTDGGRTWAVRTDSLPGEVNDLHFFDDQNGLACGHYEHGGTIWKTTDGGVTWTSQTIDSSYSMLSEMYFLDDEIGWAVGDLVAATTDGGTTWEIRFDDYESSPDAVQFFSATNGFGLDNHTFYITDDGGRRWVPLPLSLEEGQSAVALKFTDTQTGWVVGSEGAILHTTNGGYTWQPQTSGVNNRLYDLDVSGSNLVVVGGNGKALHTSNGGQTWALTAGQTIVDGNLWAVDFADANNGWAVGGNYYPDNGRIILKTTDGGVNWVVVVDHPDSSSMYDVAAPDPNNIWISGSVSGLWHSTDGGESWSIQPLQIAWYGDRLQFFNADSGWTSIGTRLAYTTNSGQDWELVPTLMPDASYWFFFLDMQNGWSFGGKPANIYHTTDGGLTWTQQYFNQFSEDQVQDLWFSDPLNGWAVLVGEGLLHTTDGGDTWNAVDLEGLHSDWVKMSWADADHGWVLNCCAPAIYTTDGGVTWLTAEFSADGGMTDIDFVDAEHGWLVGQRGIIQKWNGNPNAAEPRDRAPIAQQIDLSAYPNPFNPQTTLSFSVPQTGHVQVNIYDLTGRLVDTLTDRVLPAGTYTHSFDGRGLPTGIYFVRLNTPGNAITRKIVLLR